MATKRLVHCHCVYAKVVPAATKAAVLERLAASGAAFEAVPDLCEMAARKDPALARYADDGELEIVACFPRAVEWLFHASGNALPDKTPILNMRAETPEDIAACLAGERAMPDPNAVSDSEVDPVKADPAEVDQVEEQVEENA